MLDYDLPSFLIFKILNSRAVDEQSLCIHFKYYRMKPCQDQACRCSAHFKNALQPRSPPPPPIALQAVLLLLRTQSLPRVRHIAGVALPATRAQTTSRTLVNTYIDIHCFVYCLLRILLSSKHGVATKCRRAFIVTRP